MSEHIMHQNQLDRTAVTPSTTRQANSNDDSANVLEALLEAYQPHDELSPEELNQYVLDALETLATSAHEHYISPREEDTLRQHLFASYLSVKIRSYLAHITPSISSETHTSKRLWRTLLGNRYAQR